MRALLLGIIVSAGAGSGCFGGVPAAAPVMVYSPCEPVILDPSGEVLPEERESIGDAAAMWNAVAMTRLALEGPTEAQRIPIWFEEAAPFHYGVYRDELGDVVVNRRLRDRSQRAITIAHEVGHAFGLLHVPDGERPSLMNSGNLTLEPTPGDADALEELWGCLSSSPRAP